MLYVHHGPALPETATPQMSGAPSPARHACENDGFCFSVTASFSIHKGRASGICARRDSGNLGFPRQQVAERTLRP